MQYPLKVGVLGVQRIFKKFLKHIGVNKDLRRTRKNHMSTQIILRALIEGEKIKIKKRKEHQNRNPHSNKLEKYMYRASNTNFEEIIFKKFNPSKCK